MFDFVKCWRTKVSTFEVLILIYLNANILSKGKKKNFSNFLFLFQSFRQPNDHETQQNTEWTKTTGITNPPQDEISHRIQGMLAGHIQRDRKDGDKTCASEEAETLTACGKRAMESVWSVHLESPNCTSNTHIQLLLSLVVFK